MSFVTCHLSLALTQFQQEEKTKRKLDLLKKKEEEGSVQILSQKYKIPYLDLATFPIETDALKLIPEERARVGELTVIQAVGKNIKVGVRNPEKEETKAALKVLELGEYHPELFLVSPHSLEHAWEYYKKATTDKDSAAGMISIYQEKLAELEKEIKNLEDIKNLITKTSAGKTTEVLEVMLAGALAVDASDIHVEAQRDVARLRFRLDGVLQDVSTMPHRAYTLLLSRIKLVSELKLNIHDKAQDGRFTIKSNELEIEVRTSTLPGPNGENIVLRILNPKSIGVKFEELGMQPWVTKLMEHELGKPNGMILTTGPTGSGKTTTLYAFLKKIHNPEIKIITLEDPIEYHLTGVEQTQIESEKGYDFASGLRSVLRQDPDVILVGEIRDKETAETAMHAALTGHLVFSTLHTNNAAGTVPRLIDLGVKPAIIAPALNISMAQRLVRKLCISCRLAVNLTGEEKNRMEKELSELPKMVTAPAADSWTIFKASTAGCTNCHNGYKDRIGVYEIILIDDPVEALILKEPSEYEIKKEAVRQGQINMRQDGLLKVLAGVTDLAELERIIGSAGD